MSEFRIDRFFETCLRRRANEGWLVVGLRPLIRIDDQLRELQTSFLTASDVLESVRKFCGPSCFAHYETYGHAEFTAPYRDGLIEFHATIFRHAGECMAFFRVVVRPPIEVVEQIEQAASAKAVKQASGPLA